MVNSIAFLATFKFTLIIGLSLAAGVLILGFFIRLLTNDDPEAQ